MTFYQAFEIGRRKFVHYFHLMSLSLALVFFACTLSLSAQETTRISGLVRDPLGHPAIHVEVIFMDEQTGSTFRKSTDSKGQFEFLHQPCNNLRLEVRPRSTSGLSYVLVEHIPGNKTRQLVIHLKQGFAVTGKVTYKGKGIKGLRVQALPAAISSQNNYMHDGGLSTTNSHGKYHFVLTPGLKELTVLKDKRTKFALPVHQTLMVTSDKEAPDIIIPEAKINATDKISPAAL